MSLGGGDKLARGGVKAQFPSNSSIDQAKWNSIFDDFDPIKFKADEDAKQAERERSHNSDEEPA